MSIEEVERWVLWFGGVVIIATPVIIAIEVAAKKWQRHALGTVTKLDDQASSAVVKFCDVVLAAFAFLPRVSTGLAEAKRIRNEVAALGASPAQDPEQIR